MGGKDRGFVGEISSVSESGGRTTPTLTGGPTLRRPCDVGETTLREGCPSGRRALHPVIWVEETGGTGEPESGPTLSRRPEDTSATIRSTSE